MNITIETKRLLIRPIVPADAEAVFRWASDPLVTRYMVYTTHTDVENTRAWLESLDIEDEDSYDLGIAIKETGELIGMGGLIYKPDTDEWNLGYNLRRDYWGKGIATEAMKAIIDCVRSRRKVRRIRGRFAIQNVKSQRVMEKLGMHYLEDSKCIKFDGTELPAKTYVIDYEEDNIMERVVHFLKEAEVYYLATADGDQPRVRPFGTAHIFEGKLYIQTGKVKDVSKQLHANPKAEICAFKNGEWVRVAGELIPDDRREARQSMLDAYPSLQKMYSADDGNTEVFYFQNATATFSSFTHEPEVVKF